MSTNTTKGPLPTSSGPAAYPAMTAPGDDDLISYMQLVAEGLSTVEICARLFMSETGVYRLRKAALERLGARSLPQAALLAQHQGWLPDTAGRRLHPCGTYAAHRRHQRRGEPIDDACAAANSAHRAARKQRNVTGP